MKIAIDYGVAKNCTNPDSYGMICVKCGQCGREFSPSAPESETQDDIKESDNG